jgi:hypothetical protein
MVHRVRFFFVAFAMNDHVFIFEYFHIEWKYSVYEFLWIIQNKFTSGISSV